MRAWAEVSLAARDPHSDAQIAGIADGVLAPEGLLAGTPGAPFFLVMEAKRGMDATDPRPALLGALVAVLSSRAPSFTKTSGERHLRAPPRSPCHRAR